MKPFHRRRHGRALAAATLAGLLLSSGCADTSDDAGADPDDPCASLAGEDITLVVPYSTGGGYDSYARMIAPTLGEKVGARVVVQNQPGAGGLLALNNLLRAKPDGRTIAIMNGIGAGGAALAQAEGATFELDRFSYLGRVAGDAQMIVSKADGPYDSWDDVRSATGFRFGSTGPGAADYVTPSLLIAVFDLDARMVTGFEGSSEVELALLQGNVDGMSGQVDSRRAALESGEQTALLTFDAERTEIAPDTPTPLELDIDDEQKRLLEAHLALISMGRPLVGPPDLAEPALTCLRTGLADAVRDPELVAESEKQERPFNYLSGEDLDAAVDRLLGAPEEYVTLLKDAY